MIAAIAISGLVYLACLGLIALGIALIWASGGFVIGVIFGVGCLGLAWLMRPRIPRIKGTPFQRSDLPRTFRLLDTIAASMGAKGIDGIVISAATNAAYGQFGFRRKRILSIGLPLLAGLEPNERVAMLAHELGHAINGDPGRLLVVTSGLNALLGVFDAMVPAAIMPTVREGLIGYATIPFRVVQLAIAYAILGLALVQLSLIYRQSQRAELFADAQAARTAGSRPMIGLLGRLFAAEAVAGAPWTDRSADPVAAIASRLQSTPAREIERMRRVEAIDGRRLDTTHPPTGDREQVIRSRPVEPGTVHLNAGESDAIDRELEPFRARIGARIRERSLAAIS